MQFRHRFAPSWLAVLLLLAAAAPAEVTAQGHPRGEAQHNVRVVVPSIVRIIADPVARNVDGSPVLRVVTNDPAIRAQYAAGVPTVVVRRGDSSVDPTRHAKGGSDLEPEAGVEVRRSTVVAP